MNANQPAFSFDQGQPPTPSRTPTSPAFDSSFHTPKFESSFFDERVTWNTADPNAASPLLLRTPKPISFETPRPDKSGGFGDQSKGIREASQSVPASNAEPDPATPSLHSRSINFSPGVGYTPNFGAAAQNTSPQAGLSLDLSNSNNSFESTGSLQTPPPTVTSAEKRQNKKKLAQPGPAPKLKTSSVRRMSVPIAPKTDNGAGPSRAEEPTAQYASLDFSPDVLGYNFAVPATAPAYPQQKLFWDTEGSNGANIDFGQDLGNNPFDNAQNLGLDPFSPGPNQQFNAQNTNNFLDFSAEETTAASFLQPDTSNVDHQNQVVPNDFGQSYNGVDPSLLFSSPTKLPEPLPEANPQSRYLNEESLQPYAHQVQEARREKSYGGVGKSKKRRKPSVDSPAVRAALENLREDRDTRPAMRRSMTDSFVSGARRASSNSRPGSLHGRSSPLKRIREATLQRKSRPSVSLSIDENGRAVLVGGPEKPSGGDDMDLDSQSDSSTSEESDNPDEMMMASFSQRSSMPKLGRFNSSASHSQKSSNTSLYSDSQPSLPELKQRPATSGANPRLFGVPPLKPLREATSMEEDGVSEAETIADSDNGEDANAQSQLRKVMRGRREPGRGAPPKHHIYSPQTNKQHVSLALNTDPFLSNLSPTTMTDPDLATPTSASSSTSEAVRCICNGTRDDNQMIQCDSCRKWLHMSCTNTKQQSLPDIYLCLFCTGQTPTVRGGRVRDPSRKVRHTPSSPLAQVAPKFR